MSETEVEYIAKDGEQVVPITDFSKENIDAIPLGSEVIIVNMAARTVEGGVWSERMVEQFYKNMDRIGREAFESALVLLQVPVLDDPSAIVHRVLEDWALSTDERENISIPPQTFIEILVDTAQRAQRQKKWEGEDHA